MHFPLVLNITIPPSKELADQEEFKYKSKLYLMSSVLDLTLYAFIVCLN
jgi:hypothetical protein